LLQSWLVKAGDQVRPLQIVAVVWGPWKDVDGENKQQGTTQPVSIVSPTENTLLELVPLAGSQESWGSASSQQTEDNDGTSAGGACSTNQAYLQPCNNNNNPTTTGQPNDGVNYMGLRLPDKMAGKVSCLLVDEHEWIAPQQVVLYVDMCDHKVQFNGNCAICGLEMDIYCSTSPVDSPRDYGWTRSPSTLVEPQPFQLVPSQQQHLNPAYTHPKLRVSRNELEMVERENTLRLLKRRKLSLVLDLDNTLIHATMMRMAGHCPGDDVDICWKKKMDIYELDVDGSISLVKLRPNVRQFLENIQQKYELHIYTMGSRCYADAIAALLDPTGVLFQRRVVSRDDFSEGMMNRKNLRRIFPCDDSMVIIVDDREDVWLDPNQGRVVPNLIRARPYLFFSQEDASSMNGKEHANDGAWKKKKNNNAVQDNEALDHENAFHTFTENDENYLDRLEQLLMEMHRRFFEQLDAIQDESIASPLSWKRDVKWILSSMRHDVLKNCYISFTGVFRLEDTPRSSSIWRLAEEFGAVCSEKITKHTTHLVVDRQRGLHTGKTKYAMQRGDIFVVTLEWLETSMQFYWRANELQFAVHSPSHFSCLCSDDLEQYRQWMEQRHQQWMQNEEESTENHHGKPWKRRKTAYSSSSSSSSNSSTSQKGPSTSVLVDVVASDGQAKKREDRWLDEEETWGEEEEENTRNNNNNEDDDGKESQQQQQEEKRLRKMASYLALELEKELHDSLCMFGK